MRAPLVSCANSSKGTCQPIGSRSPNTQCDNDAMTTAIHPRTIAYALRPGHAGDPNVPDRDLTLIRTGHVVFSDPYYNIGDERPKVLLNEVLQHIACGRKVRHDYTDAHHVTIELTDTDVIARDFDGNYSRQSFHCLNETIIYNARGVDGPITPGEFDRDDYIINHWA